MMCSESKPKSRVRRFRRVCRNRPAPVSRRSDNATCAMTKKRESERRERGSAWVLSAMFSLCRFGEELADQTEASCTDRQTDGHFRGAPRCARKQQVGDVGAG